MTYGTDPSGHAPGHAPGDALGDLARAAAAAASPFARSTAAAVVDASGVVTADVPCRKCSYNIRGLAVHGRCPECGTPVGVSIHGDLLRFSDPRWLQSLARGAALLFWGIILGIGFAFVAGLLAHALGQGLVQLVGLAGGLVQLYGAWLLTEPDPSGIGEDRYGTARKVIRVSLIVGLGQNLFNLIASQGRMSQDVLLMIAAVGLVAGLIGLVGQFALLRYLERLALRIPDNDLSARARFLFWAYGGTLAAVLVLGGGLALVAAAAGPAVRDLAVIVMVVGCVAVIALIVFGIMFLMLLWRLKSVFEAQAHYARQVWAGGAQSYGAA
jgi:hypothetical protein